MEQKVDLSKVMMSQIPITVKEYIETQVEEKYRKLATQAALECLQLGYPMNSGEIQRQGRKICREGRATEWKQ